MDDDDSGLAQIVGTCEDLCPEAERIQRIHETDVHKLEIVDIDGSGPKYVMIKKFQRSSADHELQIPRMLRTPETLLNTVKYIEENIMGKADAGYDPKYGDISTKLFVYLFIWDRFRMIAKDFTLQISVLPVTDVWVECHERMARWFIYMDHMMKSEDDFIHGHAQQNGEQLNNMLKTLHGYYSRPVNPASNVPAMTKLNQGEFTGYFIIFQIGNGGEVAKYLQRLSPAILSNDHVRFAVSVWSAVRTENYAQFFKLLKQANVLQACLMHRYIGSVRYQALKKLCRTWYLPSKNADQKTLVPIADIISVLFFEESKDCIDFLTHCGVEIIEEKSTLYAGIINQNLDHLLPRDKNNHPIYPTIRWMPRLLNADKMKKFSTRSNELFNTIEVCRGTATNSSLHEATATINAKSVLAEVAKRSPPQATFAAPSSTLPSKQSIMKRLQMTGSLSSTRSPNAVNPSPVVTPMKSPLLTPSKAPTPDYGNAMFTPMNHGSLPAEALDTIPKAPAFNLTRTPITPMVPTNKFAFPQPVLSSNVVPPTTPDYYNIATPMMMQQQQKLESTRMVNIRENKNTSSKMLKIETTPTAVGAGSASEFQWNPNAPTFYFGTASSVPAAVNPPIHKLSVPTAVASTNVSGGVFPKQVAPSPRVLSKDSVKSPKHSPATAVSNKLSDTSIPPAAAVPSHHIHHHQEQVGSCDSDEVPVHILQQLQWSKVYRALHAWKTFYDQQNISTVKNVLLNKYFHSWQKRFQRMLEKRDTFVTAIQSISMDGKTAFPPRTPPNNKSYSKGLPTNSAGSSSSTKKKRTPLRMYSSIPYQGTTDSPALDQQQQVQVQVPKGLLSCISAHMITISPRQMLFMTYLHYALLTLQTQHFLQQLCLSSHPLKTSKEEVRRNRVPETGETTGEWLNMHKLIASLPANNNNKSQKVVAAAPTAATTTFIPKPESSPLSSMIIPDIEMSPNNLLVLIHHMALDFLHQSHTTLYPSDLYFKVALFSPSMKAGVFTNVDCFVTTMIRSLLSNPKGFFANFANEKKKKSMMDEETILRLFQIGKLTPNNKHAHTFQLGLFTHDLPTIQSEGGSITHALPTNNQLHMGIVEIVNSTRNAPHISASSSTAAASAAAPSVVDGCNASILLLSDYYSVNEQRLHPDYLHEIKQNILRRTPFILFVVTTMATENAWKKVNGYPSSQFLQENAWLQLLVHAFEEHLTRQERSLFLQLVSTTVLVSYTIPTHLTTTHNNTVESNVPTSISVEIPLLQYSLQDMTLVAACQESIQSSLGSLFWNALCISTVHTTQKQQQQTQAQTQIQAQTQQEQLIHSPKKMKHPDTASTSTPTTTTTTTTKSWFEDEKSIDSLAILYEQLPMVMIEDYSIPRLLQDQLITMPALQPVQAKDDDITTITTITTGSASASYSMKSIFGVTQVVLHKIHDHYLSAMQEFTQFLTQSVKEIKCHPSLPHNANALFYPEWIQSNTDDKEGASLNRYSLVFDRTTNHYSTRSLPIDWQATNGITALITVFLPTLQRHLYSIHTTKKRRSLSTEQEEEEDECQRLLHIAKAYDEAYTAFLTAYPLTPASSQQQSEQSQQWNVSKNVSENVSDYPGFQTHLIQFLTMSPEIQQYHSSVFSSDTIEDASWTALTSTIAMALRKIVEQWIQACIDHYVQYLHQQQQQQQQQGINTRNTASSSSSSSSSSLSCYFIVTSKVLARHHTLYEGGLHAADSCMDKRALQPSIRLGNRKKAVAGYHTPVKRVEEDAQQAARKRKREDEDEDGLSAKEKVLRSLGTGKGRTILPQNMSPSFSFSSVSSSSTSATSSATSSWGMLTTIPASTDRIYQAIHDKQEKTHSKALSIRKNQQKLQRDMQDEKEASRSFLKMLAEELLL